MNKNDLVQAVADEANLSKADAARAVDAVLSSVGKALKQGDTVALVGFGTFQVKERAARTGRNPRTGEQVKVPSKRTPYFKMGKELKERLNG